MLKDATSPQVFDGLDDLEAGESQQVQMTQQVDRRKTGLKHAGLAETSSFTQPRMTKGALTWNLLEALG